MDAGVGLVRVVLEVGVEGAGLRDGEDVAVAGVFVEGVAVDGVGGLFCGEEEDRAGVGFGVVCFGCCGTSTIYSGVGQGARLIWTYGHRLWRAMPHGLSRLGS